jgi:hypothetical protein
MTQQLRRGERRQDPVAVFEEELSDDDEEVDVAEEFEEKEVHIAMDSGAGKNVAPPDLIEGYKVSPSNGSKRGKHFVAANGAQILNLGETMLNMDDEQGHKMRSNFQVAEVSRMLYSVSQTCDTGCEVHFTASEGVVTKGGKVVANFPRRGGLYVMTTKLKSPQAHDPNPKDFGRRGA